MKRHRHRKRKNWLYDNKDYAERYPDPAIWSLISKGVRSLCPFCSYPGCWIPAKEVHHVIYLDSQNRPLNRIGLPDLHNLAGKILFPLCQYHHGREHDDQVHHPDNWYSGELPPPRFDAFQYPAMHRILMKGWQEKTQ